MDNIEYGKWCTIEGERHMITGYDEHTGKVSVLYRGNIFEFGVSRISDVSDFKTTDAERKALGYAF